MLGLAGAAARSARFPARRPATAAPKVGRTPVPVVTCAPKPVVAPMKKTILPGLLAAALLAFTLPSCGPSVNEGDGDVVTTELPPLPPAPDTTGGKKTAPQYRELTAPNASEDIKKMQPQM